MDRISVVAPANTPLRVTSHSGKVRVIAGEREDVLAEATAVQLETDDSGTIVIRSDRPSSAITVRCPVGSSVTIGTSSGSIETFGELGDVRATSASGSVSIEFARSADLRSEAGKVHIGECLERCRVQTTSGSVDVSKSEAAEVATNSGQVVLGDACGKTRVRTASGRVQLSASGRDDITIQTMSGGVTVQLPSDVRPAARLHSLSGNQRCELPDGDDCLVAVQSMQGAIEVLGTK